ncbi:MAG: hypothetical protein AB7O43_01045 [Hyphomicrobiaceae bacterium]
MANVLSRLFRRGDSQSGASANSDAPEVERGDIIGEALADREAEVEYARVRASTRSAEPPLSAEEAAALAQRVSEAAYALIVRHETGGRDYYEKVYKARPVWPGASSGVTIGFGYDLGWQESPEAFAADWSPVLPEKHVELLTDAVGLRSVEPGRNAKVAQIKELLGSLIAAGVRVPWEPSEAVFRAVTVPRFAQQTAAALPGHEVLSPDCFGALVSLTFNRGPSYDREYDPANDRLDRYREMRGIKAAVMEGRLERVPALIRSMKRLWKGMSVEAELTRRRENEARLFEEGLAAIEVAELEARTRAASDARRTRTRSGGGQIRGVLVHDVNDEAAEELELEELRRGTDFAKEALRAAARVTWSPDEEAPDYAHLKSKLGDGIRFTLHAADLEQLAELNGFPIDEAGDKPVLFGLRGCAIIQANEDDFEDTVLLRDQRPNHKTIRCVIGVWDRTARRIAVFPASTVPNESYVTSWYKTKSSGNLLPTGFYRYIVGPHNGRPGCFLLRERINKKHTVIVRRSSDDLAYDTCDDVSRSEPGDNLHPSFSMEQGWFSSAGCQVVVGQATTHTGNHKGPWAKFRRLAGLKTTAGKEGDPYVYMLLTGHEAMLAARAREEGSAAIPEVRQSLMRLRFGSKGEKVGRLQAFLGIDQTGDFNVDTAQKLYELQQSRMDDASDGILTPAFDDELKAGVFADQPPDAGPAVAEVQSPAEQPSSVAQVATASAAAGADEASQG